MFDAGLELDVGEVRANVFDLFRDVARIMEDQNSTFWVAEHDWHPVTLSFVGLNEKRHALAFGVKAETTPSSDTQEKVFDDFRICSCARLVLSDVRKVLLIDTDEKRTFTRNEVFGFCSGNNWHVGRSKVAQVTVIVLAAKLVLPLNVDESLNRVRQLDFLLPGATGSVLVVFGNLVTVVSVIINWLFLLFVIARNEVELWHRLRVLGRRK